MDKISTVELNVNLLHLGIPPCPAPIAAYVPVKCVGDLLFVSGQGSTLKGRLGENVTLEEGALAAQECALKLLACLKTQLDLDDVEIIKCTGFVNCTPSFTDSPKVINGCSELLVKVMGEKGRHARAAVGVSALPGNSAVEIELIAHRIK